ncbi:MAG: N-acetyl-alpha-D-glucosaminyl L-malate synthase BshA [Calditrichaeota bacterium]|nr:MAG: N-acetyl-alpha-D-glucosaminyl L-malate synthase BshA [Calditrichota bacterium]
MKIGISCYPTYGGSGVVATELGIELAQRGHEIHFISYALPHRLHGYYENIFFHEVKVPQYPLFEYPPYALALATKMADIAIHEQLDLIHAHYAIPHAISAYLAREMLAGIHPLKIITTLHGTDITLVGADPSFLRITQYSINQSDAVTAVSNFLKEQTVQTFRPTKPIQVIYNFIRNEIQTSSQCRHLRQKLSPNGEPIIVHLSNFRPVKRVLDTILVTQKVREKFPVRLVLIGDGPDRPLAENLVEQLELSKDVVFLGKQDDIYGLLAVGDVFLLPSESESFGLAALEAMSCGLPCVTSDAGGLPELNLDGETGFLAPVGDVQAMSDHIIKVLTNPELKEQLSQNARNRAKKYFHSEKIIPQYIQLYETVLSR